MENKIKIFSNLPVIKVKGGKKEFINTLGDLNN